jgi:hypothetical protein
MNLLKADLFMAPFRPGRLVTMAIVLVSGLLPQQSNAEGIEWIVAPYLWGSGVGLDVTVNDDPVIGTDVPLSDLIDKLDGVFMGHFEGRGERFGVYVDTIYLSLADSNVIPIGPGGPILGDLITDMSLTLKLYEIGGAYRIGDDSPGSMAFDILLAARLVDVDQNLDLILPGPAATPVNLAIAISETDVVLGARLIGKFTEKWHYKVRADVAGGGTDGTFNVLGAVGYTFGQTGLFSLDLGYRYMKIELENNQNGTSIETDITMSGPLLGFIFKF